MKQLPDTKIKCPVVTPIDPEKEGYTYHDCGCDKCEANEHYVSVDGEIIWDSEMSGNCRCYCTVDVVLSGDLYYRCPVHGFVQKYVDPISADNK